MPATEPDLDRLDGWVEMAQTQRQLVYSSETHGRLYCPPCGGVRRVAVAPLYHRHAHRTPPPPVLESSHGYGPRREVVPTSAVEAAAWLVPALFSAHCDQSDTTFTALIHAGANGPTLALFPACQGGVSTPHTPEAVAYYLDQAHRSQSVGAYGAALGMFRAALDQLLLEQGFKGRMCGEKIHALEVALQADAAPAWARDVAPNSLRILKQLGDVVLHPSDGSVEPHNALDPTLVHEVSAAFIELLDAVYEKPVKRKARQETLEDAHAKLSPRREKT